MSTHFNAAFSMPTTPAEAVAVLKAWSIPFYATFNAHKCAVIAQLISDALQEPGKGEVFNSVSAEIARAIEKFPTWPTDPLHAVAVLGEEFGELTKAVLQTVYEPNKSSLVDVRKEAIQTAAMALRFIVSIDRYSFEPCLQHEQEPTP